VSLSVRLVLGAIRRGRTLALHPGVIELPAGTNVGVIGSNGAGKSTLMHALAGSLRHRAGTVQLVADPPTGPAKPVAYTPQVPAFPAWLTAERVVRLYHLELGQLIAAFPGLLLGELRGRRAGTLSVGQRQALSVAISLGLDAPLLLLDEPFAAIDFRRRLGLIDILRARRPRTLALISSQSGADLLETCDWLLVLREGRCVFNGPVAGLAGAACELVALERNVLALLSAPRRPRGRRRA
jgi:ABC-type multidrug transport system ATPase subunit